jgi:triosephosphate isomerase (TIM)
MSTAPRSKLIAGNWKMNGLSGSLGLAAEIRDGAAGLPEGVDLLVCPPATLVAAVAQALKGSKVAVGGQDCHSKPSGAHTGDISAEMLADAGASHVIVGHSERREHHGETDALVKQKAAAAHRAGLVAVACVGETRAQREAGEALDVVRSQVQALLDASVNSQNMVIAYEPVWAIGTGLTPTVNDVAEVHAAIRETLASVIGADEAGRVKILYGGSVKPSNAKELMAVENVDGALVGGASLVAGDFLDIARAC